MPYKHRFVVFIVESCARRREAKGRCTQTVYYVVGMSQQEDCLYNNISRLYLNSTLKLSHNIV
jgi:hypothetical protein